MVTFLGRPSAETSLKNLCLTYVKNNFGSFMEEYEVGTTIPKEHFEQLQLICSKELFQSFANSRYYPRYADFLVNKHLWDVALDFVENDKNYKHILRRFKKMGKSVTHLTLSGVEYGFVVLLELTRYIPNVEYLTMLNVSVNDGIMENIGTYCTKLKSLNLSGSDVSDGGLKLLCPINPDGSIRQNMIQSIELRRCVNVTPIGIAFVLKNFPVITDLIHWGVGSALYVIHAHDAKNPFFQPRATYKLKELIMTSHVGLDVDFLALCSLLCPDVAKINFHDIKFQSQIDGCGKFKLKEMVTSAYDPSINFSAFLESGGKHLECLHVMEGTLSVRSLQRFCPNLKSLFLQNVRFEPLNGVQHAAFRSTCHRLESFSLHYINFQSETAKQSVNAVLSSAPNLQQFNVVLSKSLTLNFIDSITKHDCMKSIKEINTTSSDIESSAMKMLFLAAPNLTKFIVIRCPLSREDYLQLRASRPSTKIQWTEMRPLSPFQEVVYINRGVSRTIELINVEKDEEEGDDDDIMECDCNSCTMMNGNLFNQIDS